MKLDHQEKPPKIKLYVNGDMNFVPKTVLVDVIRIPDLDHFMEVLAPKFPPSVLIRRIYRLDNGRRVWYIQDLKDGEEYAVSINYIYYIYIYII